MLRGIHIDSRATIYLKLRLHSEPAVSVVSRPVTKRIKGVARPTNVGVASLNIERAGPQCGFSCKQMTFYFKTCLSHVLGII